MCHNAGHKMVKKKIGVKPHHSNIDDGEREYNYCDIHYEEELRKSIEENKKVVEFNNNSKIAVRNMMRNPRLF